MGLKKQYKKVYIEITNRCNLTCDFCIQNKRELKELSKQQFQEILEKLRPFTSYLYFHILGEPLLHSHINELIDMASCDFQVHITTNGYLIQRISTNPHLRQVNISLHSFHPRYSVSLEEYLRKIVDGVERLIYNGTYVSLRLWVKNEYTMEMIDYLNCQYQCCIDFSKRSYKIKEYLFVEKFHEFIWPDLENCYYQTRGTCYGLRDHFGILVDGTIVPCCLDTEGVVALGNIYRDDLSEVLSSRRCQDMREGFQKYEKREELCRHCSFLE